MSDAIANEVEKAEDTSPVTYWTTQLALAAKEERSFREDGRMVVKRYRGYDLSDYDTTERSPISKFNILWSNTETLKPALYSQRPRPDVRRRNFSIITDDAARKARDQAAKEAAMVLERAVSVSIDDGHFDEAMRKARDDVLLPGRGVVRVRYKVIMRRIRPDVTYAYERDPETDEPVLGDGGEPNVIGQEYSYEGESVDEEVELDNAGEPYIERKGSEKVYVEYVFWSAIRFQPARTWEECGWVAFEHFMTLEQLEDNFGKEKAGKIPLTASKRTGEIDPTDADTDKPPEGGYKLARLWEIFDKDGGQRVWIADGYKELVEREDDPMELERFYPMARPLTFYTTNERMVPLSEFRFYQDQALELDTVNGRITRLTALLKACGVYDSVVETIIDVHALEDGELAPTDVGNELRQKGGLDGSIFMWPIETIAQVLTGLYRQRDALLTQIYELTGISDLVRGQTMATETLGAQQLKAGFGTLRMSNRTVPMTEFARDTLRIMAEIIGENFEKETLEAMTGMRISDAAMAMLRHDHLRYFLLDIETDATVRPDAEAEKAEAVEMLSAITGYLQQAVAIGTANPAMIPLLLQLLKWGLARFKVSREIEEMIDEAIGQLEAQAQPGAGPAGMPGAPAPGPDGTAAPNVTPMPGTGAPMPQIPGVTA